MKANKTRQVLWRLGLCTVLLVWVFHSIFLGEGRAFWEREGHAWQELSRAQQWQVGWTQGPVELWRALSVVRPLEGLLSLVFMGCTILLGVIRWRMVLNSQGLRLPLWRTAEISFVAQFFNAFLLGSTGGDLMKAYYAARETHHLKTEAVVTVFVDRLIGLLSMLAFASIMMLPNWGLLAGYRRLSALAWVILAMLAGGSILAGLSFWGGLSRYLPQAREWLRRLPKGEMLERSLEACRRFGKEKKLLLMTVGLSMALNTFCVLQFWVLARGLGMAVEPWVLFFTVPTIICISALPVTPSGLGVRENLYVWILTVPQIAVPATQALSLSLLAYAGFLLWSLLGGVLYLTFKQRHHLAEVVTEDSLNEGAIEQQPTASV